MGLFTVAIVHRTLLALSAVILLSVTWRTFTHDSQDPYRCGSLLSKGQWLDNPRGFYNDKKFKNWQPKGCMLHEYNAGHIKKCVKHNRLIFIGDSTTRQVFWATAKKLDKGAARKEMSKPNKHEDLNFSKGGVDLDFIWDPFMNSSRLHDELVAFRPGSTARENEDPKKKTAAVVMIGGGLWHARHIENKALEEYKDAIDTVTSFVGSQGLAFPRVKNVNPPNLRNGSDNLVLVAPVQVPYYQKLSPSRAATIRPEKISAMNDYLLQLSSRHGLEVMWSYALMTWHQPSAYEESGLHVVENIATRRADILLNMRCNSEANADEYPHDRTCCAAYRPPNWEQVAILLLGLLIMPMILIMTYGRYRRLQKASNTFQGVSFIGAYQLVFSLGVFVVVICFCYYADRTWLFEKAQKSFSRKVFFTLCGLAFLIGTLSLRLSTSRTKISSKETRNAIQDQPFLSREQTDEWKGWMQFIVLIYHYTGASKVLWIYEIIRLLVASYLFMTGFGHVVYFCKTDDYSLRRVASVLLRLNILACVLPYAMHTDYLFYYFAPLVSFWFVIIYLTMRIGHSRNQNFLFLLFKITVSATLTTAFTKVPGILDTIFKIVSLVCRISWDLKEWRFRVFLDMYIVYTGMIVGILFVRLTSKPSSNASDNLFLRMIRSYFTAFHVMLALISIIILPGYWFLTRRSPDKFDFNWWQPYISCLPIVSYVILRNSHRMLRNIHSSIFAWLGRCSLETFTLQFHIWLAADTKGILSLGLFSRAASDPAGRWIEFAILTAIFLWVSWATAAATTVLTAWIVDPKKFQSSVKAIQPTHLRTKSEVTMVLPSTKTEEDVLDTCVLSRPGILSLNTAKKTKWDGAPVGNAGGEGRLGIRLLLILASMFVLNWAWT